MELTMQEVAVVLVAGFLIGYFLDRLMSGIVHAIRKKDGSAEIGTIACAKIGQASLLEHVFENGNHDKSIKGSRRHIALISAFFTAIIVWHFGVTFSGLAALLCFYFLILLGCVDAKTGYLPDCLTYPFLCAGFFVNAKAVFVPLHLAIISAVSVYLICRMANATFRFFTGNDGMGRGDFKMIAALGAWFGWVYLIIIVMMASLLALVAGLIKIAVRRQGFEAYFPFGPYLAMAAMPVLLHGTVLMQTLNDFS